MARHHVKFGWVDWVLFGALGYASFVLLLSWNDYKECGRPIHIWLLVDYLTIMLFRLFHFLAQYVTDASTGLRKLVCVLQVGVLYTFFVAWTILGSVWFGYTRGDCVPQTNQYLTYIIWLMLCYVWAVGYCCLLFVQSTHANSPFTIINEGLQLGIIRADAGNAAQAEEEAARAEGLTPEEIASIPVMKRPPTALWRKKERDLGREEDEMERARLESLETGRAAAGAAASTATTDGGVRVDDSDVVVVVAADGGAAKKGEQELGSQATSLGAVEIVVDAVRDDEKVPCGADPQENEEEEDEQQRVSEARLPSRSTSMSQSALHRAATEEEEEEDEDEEEERGDERENERGSGQGDRCADKAAAACAGPGTIATTVSASTTGDDLIFAKEWSVSSAGSDALRCAICLTDFEKVWAYKALPICQHIFHAECIDQWLAKSNSCPCCRQIVLKKSDRGGARSRSGSASGSRSSSGSRDPYVDGPSV